MSQKPDDQPQPAQPVEAPQDENVRPRLLDFLFEAASLRRTPRTGYQFLGRGHESVAEHTFGAMMVAFALGRLEPEANLEKLLKLVLFHDLPEARTGDLNYVNKMYVQAQETAAFTAATLGLPFSGELAGLWEEWRAGVSLEARLAADADQLDMMLELRRLAAHGWRPAQDWLFYAHKRLKTAVALKLAETLSEADPDHWWFERREERWVNPSPPGERP
ncbi:MAG: HD domain-containing protein [Deltaproteobacteria bacterium]|jgi:putative hydrolase of HD superfamily|nr:HD domain-containing protein [Deltaproteobacteria bacterium]